MTDSIFTKILNREVPAEFIYEDDVAFVIPDRFPSMEGQVLVITKKQVPYIFDLTDEEYAGVMAVTRRVALALDKAFHTARTCVVIEGFDVPHIHVRLYPCKDTELRWAPRTEASDEHLRIVAEKVKNAMA